MSHLGRPAGRVVDGLRLEPVSKCLSVLLKKPVFQLEDCVGAEVEDELSKMNYGDVVLLENLRFHGEEEDGDLVFARSLAGLADIYVDDAFGAMHRAHASITGVAKYLQSYAGLLVQKEVENLSKLKSARHLFTAIIGGAKADKLGLVASLLKKVDCLVVGGLLANIILNARGEKTGFAVDSKSLSVAKKFCMNKKLILPVDFAKDANGKTSPKDIGPETIRLIKQIVMKSKTIFWAGPLGVIEEKQFRKGTYEIAKAISAVPKSKALKIVGGGTSAEVIYRLKLEKKFSWVSTGGGASIEFVQKGSLPGIEVLQK